MSVGCGHRNVPRSSFFTNKHKAILPFDEEVADICCRLRVPNPENPLDKQIAATALRVKPVD